MAYHVKLFTLKSTTSDTLVVVNPDQVELASITRTEEGEWSIMIVQAHHMIRFNLPEDKLEKLKDALRGAEGVELDAEYLAIEAHSNKG
jgi:hypothetical protein